MPSSYPSDRLLAPRAKLLGSGDPDSLQNVNTRTLPDGALCYVLDQRATYSLDKSSTVASAPPEFLRGTVGCWKQVHSPNGIQVYPDVASVQADPSLTTRHPVILVMGEGFFYWDGTSTDTPGPQVIQITGTATGRYLFLAASDAQSYASTFTGPTVDVGDVVRSTGTACTLAQADTAAHAAGTFAVRTAAGVVNSIPEAPWVNFEMLPVLGQPCYLSATSAGKLTHVASNDTIITPPDLIVAEVVSAIVPYRARIARNCGVASQLTLRESLTRRAVSLAALTPGKIITMHEPFEGLKSTAGYTRPDFGILGGDSTVSTVPSRVKLLNTWVIPSLLKGGAVAESAQRWYFRFVGAITTPGLSALSVVIGRASGTHLAQETIELGIDTTLPSPYHHVIAWGNYDFIDGHAARLNVHDLGACDANLHIFEAWSSGDGNCHARWDESDAPTNRFDFALPLGNRTEMPAIRIGFTNPYAEIDDVFVAVEQA